MRRTPYAPQPPDRRFFVGKFTGYRMLAFGKEQVLDYTAEMEVRQIYHHPPLWAASDRARKWIGTYVSPTADDTMRMVEQAFTTCLQNGKRSRMRACAAK